MSGAMTFRLSTSVLEWARNTIGYSIEEAAKKAGVTIEKFTSWEKGESNPTYRQLENLADNVYKRPLAVLLSEQPPKEDPIKSDFRNLSNSQIDELAPQVKIALRKAKRYQTILDDITEGNDVPLFKQFHVSIQDNPEESAIRFREFLNFSLEDQKSWSAQNDFANYKKLVESIGIFIFQISMPMQQARAFCITGNSNIIVLSKEDSKNGRIFSLFHELCHILFNTNSIFKDINSSESNSSYSAIERFCNLFAASFLVPDKYFDRDIANVSGWDRAESNIQQLAHFYHVSNEVIARKLLTRGLLDEPSFWRLKNFWDNMARQAKEREREKLKNQDTSGIAQDIKIISEKGRPYVSKVIEAYSAGAISSSDLSNFLEAKLDHLPKLIKRLNDQ